MHLTHNESKLTEIENSNTKTELLIVENTCTITKVLNSKYYSIVKDVEGMTLVEFQDMVTAVSNIDDDLWVQICNITKEDND